MLNGKQQEANQIEKQTRKEYRRPWLSIQVFSSFALIFIFIAAICAPPIKTIFSPVTTVSKNENRRLARLKELYWIIGDLIPHFDREGIASFPAAFEGFYNDHFGFRKTFVFLHNYIKVKLLHSTTSNVIVGKENWLFFNEKGNFPYQDYLGLRPFAAGEMEALIDELRWIKNFLAMNGIHFLFVISPNKMTIYPEYMPSEPKQTRLDQLASRLHNSTLRDNFVDVREKLHEAKGHYTEPLYFPQGTHWNEYGAYVAYQEVMNRLSKWYPSFAVLAMDDMIFSSRKAGKQEVIGWGDRYLAARLHLTGYYQQEDHYFEPGAVHRAQKLDIRYPISYQRFQTDKPYALVKEDHQLKAVVLHSSCGRYLAPFLSAHFKRAVFARGHRGDWRTIQQWVGLERPDVVIIEIVQRCI